MKEAAVPNTVSVKLADRKMSMKKEKISSYLIYNIVTFSKMAAKADLFSGTISWTCSEIPRKFRLLRKSSAILNDAK